MARPLAAMNAAMGSLRATKTLSGAQLKAMTLALAQVERISRQSQQLTRLAGKNLRQSHEKLALHAVLASVLASRLPEFRASGVILRHQLQAVEVIVDPGLLLGLLEAAVEWAAEQGQQISVNLGIKHWPEHGRLILKSTHHVAVPSQHTQAATPDSLSWHLLLQLANTMGVAVDRVVAEDHSMVVLEFARTVKHLEGLTAMEIDAGNPSASSYSESKPLAGYRVLLVSDDERLRVQVKEICGGMGLTLDRSPSTTQATRHCERSIPHMIIVDEHLNDEQFTQLRNELLRSEGHFPVIEIAGGKNVVEISSWMDDSISRVSRDELRAQLPNMLVMELAKVA